MFKALILAATIATTTPTAPPAHAQSEILPPAATTFIGRVMTKDGQADLDLSNPEGVTLVPLPEAVTKAGWQCAITPVRVVGERMLSRSVVCRNGTTNFGATSLCFNSRPDLDDQRFSLSIGDSTVVAIELACKTNVVPGGRDM
jgi:hypothetical protein